MIRLVQFHSWVARSNWASLSSGSGGPEGLSERSAGSANSARGSPVIRLRLSSSGLKLALSASRRPSLRV